MNYVPSDLEVAGASREAIAQLFDPAAGDIEFRFSGIRDGVGGNAVHRLR